MAEETLAFPAATRSTSSTSTATTSTCCPGPKEVDMKDHRARKEIARNVMQFQYLVGYGPGTGGFF